ncbi:MFS transporter [Streptomyces sp. NPDC001107]
MATTPAGARAQAEPGGDPPDGTAPTAHRQIMRVLFGLLLGQFAGLLSSTIVSSALPEIIRDLGGGQSAYTWVVTAGLLALTASTPLWGKLADLVSKKALVQTALVIYIAGSVAAGLAQSSGELIGARVVQGLGTGGLASLGQIILAAMVPPRERGRYSGFLGSTFAVATVGGPLIGGVIAGTSWLGWRWCLYAGIPLAVTSLVVLQRTLRLPHGRREVKVDWAGASFITAAVSLLMVWVTFAGDTYDWLSAQTCAMVGGALVLGAVFVLVEARAAEPIMPLHLFRNRTITLTLAASFVVGVAMFSGTVFFSQYFQLARDKSPTMSGVLTVPMVAGLFLASTGSGRLITRTGKWKAWLVAGGALLTAGLGLLGTIRYDTAYWRISIFMALLGLGIGMLMQNLVLATQNQVAAEELGAASSIVTFFRSLGGAVGVAALGSVMSSRVTHHAQETVGSLGGAEQVVAAKATDTGRLPDMDLLPAPVRTWLQGAYGHGVADVFLCVAPFAFLAFLAVLFIKEAPLREAAIVAKPAPAEAPAAP